MRATAAAARRHRLDRPSRPHGRPERRPHHRPSTRTSFAAVTSAEYFYDYTGQDPINSYDLTGSMTYPGGGELAYSVSAMCSWYDQASCPRGGVSMNWGQLLNSPCVRGAITATAISGPEDAFTGCLVSVAIDKMSSSKSSAIRAAGALVATIVVAHDAGMIQAKLDEAFAPAIAKLARASADGSVTLTVTAVRVYVRAARIVTHAE